MRKNSVLFLLFVGILLYCGCTIENPGGPDNGSEFNWRNATSVELEDSLKLACKENKGDITAIVAELKKNKNVQSASPSADNTSVIVKFKDSEDYSVYPIHKIADPFDEEDAYEEGAYSLDSFQANSFESSTKAASKNKIAVFNYFSNNLNRRTQNEMLKYMMNDVSAHGFPVEYYPYEKMTISNIWKVMDNDSEYKAVVIISHGFTYENSSYFVLGEEFDKTIYDADYRLFLGADDEQQAEIVPRSLRFWNEGFGAFGFGARYDCAVNVSKMKMWEQTILYLGSCDAYNMGPLQGTCIGWDGSNVTAQAHVTLLMYNLTRGRTLADALDLQESPHYAPKPYYDYTGDQTDTWSTDPITKAKMKSQLRGGFAMTLYSSDLLTPVKDYYKNGLINVKTYISNGPLFLSNKSRKVSFSLGNAANLGGDAVDYPDNLYLVVTPLRSDVSPQLYTLKEKKGSPGEYGITELKLSVSGLYVVSAFADEGLTKEILFRKPMVFVRAKPFKENGDDEEEEIIEPTEGDLIDLGLSVKWASCNLGASEPQEPGDYYAWGETNTKATYNWSTYKWCNGTETSLKKYCTQSSYGTVDNKTALELSDDAAYANSQGKMRMPTSEEWRELRDNCTWTKTHYKEHAGYLVSSPTTGNAIFIPCNGLKVSGVLNADASYYWGADLNSEASNMADAFLWPSVMKWTRCDGLGIRPVSSGQSDITTVPEAVDLGLSVKWATFNLGATKPEDFGDYYAWGETEPKAFYSWDTYKWGGRESLTKYCSSSSFGYNGFTDNKISLDPEDDAAHVNWGGNWRMPTKSDLDELGDKCTFQWISMNGVNGCKVIGPNGNSIFLPAAGEWDGDYFASNEMGIWSSSLNPFDPDDPWGAYHLDFFPPDHLQLAYSKRSCGSSIRPVYDDKPHVATPEAVDLGLSVKWASCNLGASKPEEYGDYYAWGETETKSNYGEETYKWFMNYDSNSVTKYCIDPSCGYNGFSDGKTVLEQNDDAAHVILGGKWRMPTTEEQEELITKCSKKWTSVNGILGYSLTGPSGKSIFLPAGGDRYYIYYDGLGEKGCYWSSSLLTGASIQSNACLIVFWDGAIGSNYNNGRNRGTPIRPVCTE